MALTIEHRIFNLICERLRQHMVSDSVVSIGVDSPISMFERIAVSGSFSGTYPRAFEILITGPGTCHITETTLFANLGTSAPAPYEDDIVFTAGIPFEIDSTGISITIASDYLVNDEWLIRLGNAAYSVPNIYESPIDYESIQSVPSIAVYATGNTVNQLILDKSELTMDVVLILTLSKEQVENGHHLEILGDIRDCINRDAKLWDNTTCLAEDCNYQSDAYYEQTDRGNAIFICNLQVRYRTTLNNSRIK